MLWITSDYCIGFDGNSREVLKSIFKIRILRVKCLFYLCLCS